MLRKTFTKLTSVYCKQNKSTTAECRAHPATVTVQPMLSLGVLALHRPQQQQLSTLLEMNCFSRRMKKKHEELMPQDTSLHHKYFLTRCLYDKTRLVLEFSHLSNLIQNSILKTKLLSTSYLKISFRIRKKE